jgi:hypothetical protein
MSKVLVKVNIGDNENNSFKKSVQVEINSIDYLIIKDGMECCSCEEYDESWERLVKAVERQREIWLPCEWYINGGIELLEKIY